MRAITFKNYDRIRVSVLALVGYAGVIRYPEVFANMRKLPMVVISQLEMVAKTIKEALDDLIEDGMVRVWQVDKEHFQQFSLTEKGREELNDRTLDADVLMADVLMAIRKLFPSQRREACLRGS